jgi:hypothetical protein
MLARMLSHSCWVLGDQFTLNMSLTPLHMNSARQQEKKIWSTSSGWPQNTQLPLEGPLLKRIWTLEGSLPLESCQEKILIFKGMEGVQRSSAIWTDGLHREPDTST